MSKFVKVLKGLFKDESPEMPACSCGTQAAPAPVQASCCGPSPASPAPVQNIDAIPAVQKKSGCC
jgi:hypothetical protein